MIRKKDKPSLELASAIAQVVVRAADLTPSSADRELEKVKRRFLPAAKTKRMRLETRRRIAEWKFKLLAERDVPAREIRRRYEAVRKLGFTDTETEATIKIMLAQYHARASRPDDARRILVALNKRLGSSTAYSHLRQDVARLLTVLATM